MHVRCCLALTLVLVLSFSMSAQVPTWTWGASFGTVSDDKVNSLAADAAGNIYATGYFRNTVDFDPQAGISNLTANYVDVFILKLNNGGGLEWAKRIGSTSFSAAELGQCIALDPVGNIYVAGQIGIDTVDMDPGPGTFYLTGTSSRDAFVLKLDAVGDLVWAKQITGPQDELPIAMVVDVAGSVHLCGRFNGTGVDFDPGSDTLLINSAGNTDSFVMKLDPLGDLAWATTMSSAAPELEEALGIAVDAAGHVYTTGVFAGTVDLDPGPGTVNMTAVEDLDIFIQKLTSDGQLVWARSIGGNGPQRAEGIALDASANILLTGSYPDSDTDLDPNAGTEIRSAWPNDLFVLKLDSASNFQWVRTMGEGAPQYCRGIDIATDDDGSVFASAYLTDSMDCDPGSDSLFVASVGQQDVLVFKLNDGGDLQWATTIQGTYNEIPSALALGDAGGVYVSANYHSPQISFGGITVNNASGGSSTTDMVIARLDSTDLATSLPTNTDTHSPGAVVYPVPFSDELLVSGTDANELIQLLDATGRVVLRARTTEGLTRLNTVALAPGAYVLATEGISGARARVLKW